MERPLERPETAGKHPRSLNGAECDQILEAAQIHARRFGVHRQDEDDTALGLVAHLLAYFDCHPEHDPSIVLSTPWLASVAANWTKNGLQATWLRQNRELTLYTGSAEENEDEAPSSLELISNEPSPFRKAVRSDLRHRLHSAIANSRLSPAQFEVLQLFMNGESVTGIAECLNVSPDTIRHRLRKIWEIVRSSLRRYGIGDAEVVAFLAGS